MKKKKKNGSINEVVWDTETETYKVVTNPAWDIEAEIGAYSSLVEQGFGDEVSSSIVSMINQTRPVYPCSCHSQHQIQGYSFIPCPCFDCESLTKANGFEPKEPICSVSLHKNTIHVMGSMIRQNYLAQINEVLKDQLTITNDHLTQFESMLNQYGQSTKSWSDITDSHDTDDDDFWFALTVLEQFWIELTLSYSNPD